MKIAKLSMAFLAIAVFVTSCSKGPAGPAGPTGPTGAGGGVGATGPTGVANISTTEFTVTTAQWNIYGVNEDTVWRPVPLLTDSINDGVIVQVSRTTGAFIGDWFGMPMSNFLASNDLIDFLYGNKRILFGYNFSSAPSQTLKFKVIVIPPAVMKQHPNVNSKNQAELMTLPEVQQALK